MKILYTTEVTASGGLELRLRVRLDDGDRQAAEPILREADRLCPYSNAERGNVPVDIELV